MSPHPTEEQLQSLLDDRVAKTRDSAVEAHVKQCALCRGLLERLVSDPPIANRRFAPERASLVPTSAPGRASAGDAGSQGETQTLPAGKQPVPAEGRCVDDPELLENLGLDTQARRGMDRVVAAGTATAPTSAPQPAKLMPGEAAGEGAVIGDYEILDELGHGGMGIVYRAYDRGRGRVVALKTVQWVDPSILYRFKQEFRALADLAHPNLVTLYELTSHGRDWFFTMELVEGVDFLTHVRSRIDLPEPETVVKPASADLRPCPGDNPDDATVGDLALSCPVITDAGSRGPICGSQGLSTFQIGRLRAALKQLAEGLAVLHAARKLHRDIKPSNVLVTALGRVVILDFGLAAELDPTGRYQNTEPHVLGTASYMSPEQAAELPVSPASDWYSVGVVLYEALTGRLPFLGRPLDVLTDKQRFEPPSPRELVTDLPDDLSTLCVELLQRDPEARPSGREVLRRLGSIPSVTKAPAASQPSPQPAIPLVGRERHLEALEAAFLTVVQGKTVVLYVHGRSGAGKSALVQHFLARLVERDPAVVLAGRCYEQESVPYKALDSLIDALSRYLKRLPPAEVQALLPRDIQSLARVFPVLRRVERVSAAPRRATDAPDVQELRRRAFTALRELLARIGDRRPLVLFVDDLQWGDVDSAALLSELLRPPDPPVLLLLGSYRSEDAATSPFLRQLLGAQQDAGPTLDQRDMSVEPLSPREAQALAMMLLGPDDPALHSVTAAIARESGGNPLFVTELVRHVQAGANRSDRLSPGDEVTLDRVLWARILRLPDEARRLLEIIAVSGRPLGQAEACRATAVEADMSWALAVLRSERLVRGTGPTDRDEIETYHDRIRETVVAHVPPAAMADHHRRLAHELEAAGKADPEVLAFHFDGAGDPQAAGEYCALAASRAVQALAFDRAATLYQRALDLSASGDANRRSLRINLAAALANAGHGAEAAEQYLAAADGAFADQALDLKRHAAEQLLMSGHVDEGLAVLGDVLRAVGIRFPSTPRRALASLLLQQTRLLLRGLDFRPRDAGQIPAEDLARIDICWAAGVGLCNIDSVRGVDFQKRGLLLALRTGDSFRVARALILEASLVSLSGKPGHRRPTMLLRAADRLVRQIDHPYLSGGFLISQGMVAYMTCRFRSALELLDQAVGILREHYPGAVWEIDTAQCLALYSLAEMGEVAELVRRRCTLMREAQERGDLYAEANFSTYCLPIASLGDDEVDKVDTELRSIMARWSQRGYHIQHHNATCARVMIELYRGAGARAWEIVQEVWHLYRSSLLRIFPVNRMDMLQSRGRSVVAASLTSQNPKPLLRTAESDARSLANQRSPWPSALAWIIRAGVAGAQGDKEAARRYLIGAAERFEALDMGLWARAARRRLGELIGGEDGRDLVAEADAWMNDQTIRNPARMTAMLVPGFPDR
jgi:serine/threonine protein kinase